LKDKKNLSFEFSGADWGLACNSVHFLDLITYLTGSFPLYIETDKLLPEIFPSKRHGYVEFLGKLTVSYENCHSLVLDSSGATRPYVFSVKDTNMLIKCDETNKQFIFQIDGENKEYKPFVIPYQSQMSLQIFENHISGKDIGLCPFEESVKVHLPLLKAFLLFYQKLNNSNSEIVPIT
jgi:hypothetical protein